MGENLQGSRYKIVLCSNKQYSITRELHKVHTLNLGAFRSAHARTHARTAACATPQRAGQCIRQKYQGTQMKILKEGFDYRWGTKICIRHYVKTGNPGQQLGCGLFSLGFVFGQEDYVFFSSPNHSLLLNGYEPSWRGQEELYLLLVSRPTRDPASLLPSRQVGSLIAVNGLPPSNAEGYERVELYFHSRTRHSWHSESLSTLYKRKHLYSQQILLYSAHIHKHEIEQLRMLPFCRYTFSIPKSVSRRRLQILTKLMLYLFY